VIAESAIRLRFEALASVSDERALRRFAAGEAQAAGRGGVAALSRITGPARSTIGRGLNELRAGLALDADHMRRPGGGRKPLTAMDPGLIDDLRSLVEPDARGDPQSPLRRLEIRVRQVVQQHLEIGREQVLPAMNGLGWCRQVYSISCRHHFRW